MKQQGTHPDELTIHTLSWKMKKKLPQTIASRIDTKNDIFQKHKDQNQKLSTLLNHRHTQNAMRTRKSVAVYFKDVKTEETYSSQDQKLMETTISWQLFWDKNSPAQIS